MIWKGTKISKWVDIPSEMSLQPAGVDLSVDKIFTFTGPGKLDYDNSERMLSEVKEVPFDEEVFLPPGVYKIRYREMVRIPKDAVGLCFPRSSLLRCGATVSCGVWDPGYEGKGESLLMVQNPSGLILKRGARVVQLILIKMEGEGQYKGAYQGENIGERGQR